MTGAFRRDSDKARNQVAGRELPGRRRPRHRWRRLSRKSTALIIAAFVLLITNVLSAFAQTVVGGGLTAPEIGGSLGPNLLVNGDFSQGTKGWTLPSACFCIDPTTAAPNGAASLLMSDSAACNNATPVAVNSLKVTSGQVYTLSGELKTEDLVAARTPVDGAMFDLLGYGRSPITNGTTDWTTTTLQHITVPAGVNTSVRLQTYGPVTSGDAWFANLSLQQEIPPALQMFLLYPNYRGMMFSDQSQVASVDLTVTPPAGTSLSSLQVVLNATDAGGNIVASQTVVPSSTDFTASIDLSASAARHLPAYRHGRGQQRQRSDDAESLRNRQARRVGARGHEGLDRPGQPRALPRRQSALRARHLRHHPVFAARALLRAGTGGDRTGADQHAH